ncbi:hypothetical protein [Streptomyces sp. NPDC046197]|uniref:hypothetical protein n=1 Tax=Streptomyces sp. NPDC046197 TaxID=3154337 RepID=UPI0033E06004
MDSGAIRRWVALGTTVLIASGLFALAAPGTAQAASDFCAGRRVKTLSFSAGAVSVYRNDGYVCAITYPNNPGPRQSMSVTVQARGSRPVTDQGRFSWHAGPVTVHAGHRCVRVSGSVGNKSVNSGWILC